MMKEQDFWQTLGAKLAGRFIVFDGPDGCGKSTQLARLGEGLTGAGVPWIGVRDPGDTAIGEAIRKILLGPDHADRDPRCELMLFMASRAQLVAEKIRPALAAGKTVLADRYVSASCAYQGAGGLAVSEILKIAKFAAARTWPDLTVILDIPARAGLDRIRTRRDGIHDTMEGRSLAYHERVREIFLELPERYPAPVVVVDGRGDADAVHERIVERLTSVDYGR